MKKFLLRVFVAFLLILGILAAALFFIPNKKIPDNSLFANIDKHQRLSSTNSPKVVLVGGSNWPFGVKSQMIEEAMEMPVVDMGLHAGLGVDFILSEVEKDIHEGDIVVVSLEYHHFLSRSMYHGEDVLAALLFDVNRDCLQYVKFGHWMALVPNIGIYASKKLIDIAPTTVDVFEDAFTRESFNVYGDEVAHYGMPSTVMSGNEPALDRGVYPKAVKRLCAFAQLVQSKNAKFVLVACPYPEPQYKLDAMAINDIVESVESAGLHFMIKPEECIYPDSLMFNSYFHLSEKGAEMRTERLIEVLKSCR
jgi:hypothetical protein